MDMHSVDSRVTSLTGAAKERVRQLANLKPTREERDSGTEESAEASGLRETDPKDQADRVEISDVGKVLAALSEQRDDSGDLQLPTDKLRRMIEG